MTTKHQHYIPRMAEKSIDRASRFYPIISVMGPRQAGKTQMIIQHFSDFKYFDFESPHTRKKVLEDPEKFVRDHIEGAIFDEFHFVPHITEVLKVVADELVRKSLLTTRFVLTSSHNYLHADEGITETMVGRASLIELLSMTSAELDVDDPYAMMYKGGYPVIHTKEENPQEYFRNYLRFYLEREVRMVHNIEDWKKFLLFMKMCANRVGNLISYETIQSRLGLSRKKIDHWLNILEISYIIFMAPEYDNNFEKTLTSHPKLYFYDTGLASFLLGIHSQDVAKNHDMRGALFENLVISDVRKTIMAANKTLEPSFWLSPAHKGNPGYEVDLILASGLNMKAIEIKIADTFDPHWFGNLNRLDAEKSKVFHEYERYVIYTGPTMDVPGGKALNFKDVGMLLEY